MLLTLSQMAERVNRSTKTFKKYVVEYSIPHIKLGRSCMFDEAEVIERLRTTESKQKKSPAPSRGKFAERLGL